MPKAEQVEGKLKIDWLEDRFVATKSPAYAFHAILLSRKSGEPPPHWVIDFLRQEIDFYVDDGGDASVEELLALDPGAYDAEPGGA